MTETNAYTTIPLHELLAQGFTAADLQLIEDRTKDIFVDQKLAALLQEEQTLFSKSDSFLKLKVAKALVDFMIQRKTLSDLLTDDSWTHDALILAVSVCFYLANNSSDQPIVEATTVQPNKFYRLVARTTTSAENNEVAQV